MTQPVFGEHSFTDAAAPNAQDAFDLITGEQLAQVQAAHPERSFLTDENVQAAAERINTVAKTQAGKDVLLAQVAGRWIVVAFNLGDHRSRFGMEIVTAQHPAEKNPPGPKQVAIPLRYGLTCIFDTEPWGETIATYRVGARMTVCGQIEQLNARDIRLRNCELV